MNEENVFNLKNIKTIALITIVLLILSLIFSFLQTPKYKSTAKLLVVFNQENIDAYTASRASSYISGVLGEVIYSNLFIDNVFKNRFNLTDNFGVEQEARQKNWKKMVEIKIKEDKGIIFVAVFHPDRNQAEQFAQAITYTLITKNNLYHGAGDKIVIKLIDAPITSQKLAQPKFMRNALLGLMAGLILGLTFVVIFPEQKLLEFIFNRQRMEKDETIKLVQENGDLPEVASANQTPSVGMNYHLPPDLPEPMPPFNNNNNGYNHNQHYDW